MTQKVDGSEPHQVRHFNVHLMGIFSWAAVAVR